MTTILGPKRGVPPIAAARLQRWAIQLATYTYDIEFKSTHDHGNADALSSLPLRLVVLGCQVNPMCVKSCLCLWHTLMWNVLVAEILSLAESCSTLAEDGQRLSPLICQKNMSVLDCTEYLFNRECGMISDESLGFTLLYCVTLMTLFYSIPYY